MPTTVTTKGQVTIPKPVRDFLRIEAGTAVDFLVGEDGRVTLRVAGRGAEGRSRFERARGMAGPGPSTDELMRLLRPDD